MKIMLNENEEILNRAYMQGYRKLQCHFVLVFAFIATIAFIYFLQKEESF